MTAFDSLAAGVVCGALSVTYGYGLQGRVPPFSYVDDLCGYSALAWGVASLSFVFIATTKRFAP